MLSSLTNWIGVTKLRQMPNVNMWCPACQKIVNCFCRTDEDIETIYCEECQCLLLSNAVNPQKDIFDHTSSSDKEPEYEYYLIQGSAFAELKQDCLRRGPLVLDGQRHPFYTQFHLKWDYDCQYKLKLPDKLQMGVTILIQFQRVDISVSHKIIMPSLDDNVKLPSHDEDLWHRYVDRLKQHELDHIHLSLDTEILKSLKTQISSLGEIRFGFNDMPKISDPEVKNLIALSVNFIGSKYVALIQRRYQLLDEMTEYGELDYEKDKIFKRIAELTI